MSQQAVRRAPSAQRWAELLVESGRGEEASFDLLARQVRGPMRGRALRLLNNADDADELVQEALLEAWCKADRYDPRLGGVMSWLGVMLRYRAIDVVRQTAARRSREARVAAASYLVAGDDPVDSVLRTEEHDDIRALLPVLTDLQGQAVRLVFYDGLTSAQAAAALSIPVPTMKSRLREGVRRLRDAVTALEDDRVEARLPRPRGS